MPQNTGSRRQVWNGNAKKTSGGLTKADLMMSHGRIVSKSKHFSAKKEMRLLKHGYGTKKGKFGYVKIGTKKHRKGHKKMRGGHFSVNSSLSPAGIDGQSITDYNLEGSVGVQEAAGMAGGRRHRSMRGGNGMRAAAEHGASNWNGDDLTGAGIAGAGITMGNAGSANLQLLAGMAGGRRRSRGRGMRMAGGTTKPFASPLPGSPINRALAAA